jgi:hypothetical protein
MREKSHFPSLDLYFVLMAERELRREFYLFDLRHLAVADGHSLYVISIV